MNIIVIKILYYIATTILSSLFVFGLSKWREWRLNKRYCLFEEERKKWDYNGFTPVVTNFKLRNKFFRAQELSINYLISIPQEKASELYELNFKGVDVKDNYEVYSNAILIAFAKEKLTTDKILGLIQLEINNTANDFIKDIRQGKLRFNKYLYGVSNVTEEKNECKIQLYESDYFTFKATVRLYQKINSDNILKCSKYNCEGIKELPPFLNSIGVGGFIIVNRGYGDELVFGFRSKVNCQSGGYWHFSFDETFTHDDKEGENRKPSIEGCMLRAIEEELGISEEERKICGINNNIRLLDAGIIGTSGDDNRFEFEVCGFGYVRFSKLYTYGDFCLGYRFAKDAEIETQTLSFVNIEKDLDGFIEETKSKNEISPEAYHLAKSIKLLYDLKILGDSYWQ